MFSLNINYSFLRLSLIILFSNHVLSSQLISTLVRKNLDPIFQDNNLDFHSVSIHVSKYAYLSPIGTYSPSPFSFDRDCISVVRTNTLLEVDCQLPHKCGHYHHKVYSKSFLGQEVIICYSFHQTSSLSNLVFSKIKFNPIPDYELVSSIDQHKIFHLKNIVPTDFFDHFVLTNFSTGYRVYPKICLENFTPVADKLPPSVSFDEVGDTLCVYHKRPVHDNCEPVPWPTYQQFVSYSDFPISYTGGPYNEGKHVEFANQDPDVADYARDRARGIYYIYSSSPDGSKYFGSYDTVFDYDIVSPKKFIFSNYGKDLHTQKYCYPITSLYKNPVSEIAKSILSLVEPLFFSILELLENNLEKLFKLAIKAFLLALKLSIELLGKLLSQQVISAIVCSVTIYFYYRDLVVTSVLFVCFVIIFYYVD